MKSSESLRPSSLRVFAFIASTFFVFRFPPSLLYILYYARHGENCLSPLTHGVIHLMKTGDCSVRASNLNSNESSRHGPEVTRRLGGMSHITLEHLPLPRRAAHFMVGVHSGYLHEEGEKNRAGAGSTGSQSAAHGMFPGEQRQVSKRRASQHLPAAATRYDGVWEDTLQRSTGRSMQSPLAQQPYAYVEGKAAA